MSARSRNARNMSGRRTRMLEVTDELIDLLIEYLEREDMSKRDFAERLEELMRV